MLDHRERQEGKSLEEGLTITGKVRTAQPQVSGLFHRLPTGFAAISRAGIGLEDPERIPDQCTANAYTAEGCGSPS